MTTTVKVAALSLGNVIVEGQGERTRRIRVTSVTRCLASRKTIPWFHINDHYCYFSESLVEIEEKGNG